MPWWCPGAFPISTPANCCRWCKKLDKALDDVRKAHPGYEIAVTGLSAIAARNSADMIGKLNRALTVEIVFVAAFIGFAFRSFIVMLVSILPGIFPVVMAGFVLWADGGGAAIRQRRGADGVVRAGPSAPPSTSSTGCGWRTSRAPTRPSPWSRRPSWSGRR